MSQIAKRSSKISKLTLQKLIWVDRCTVAASRYGSIQPKSDLEHHPRCTRRTCRRVDHTLHGRGKNPVIVWFRVLIVGHAVVTVIVQIPCVFSSERYAFRCAIHWKYLFLSKKSLWCLTSQLWGGDPGRSCGHPMRSVKVVTATVCILGSTGVAIMAEGRLCVCGSSLFLKASTENSHGCH